LSQVLLVCIDAPVDPLNGGDLRLWHLLNRGKAQLLALRDKTVDAADRPLARPLPWLDKWIDRAEDRSIPAAIRRWAATQRPGPVRLVVHGCREGLVCHAAGHRHFAAHLTDSMALYFRRRRRDLPSHDFRRRANAFIQATLWLHRERRLARFGVPVVITSPVDAGLLDQGLRNVRPIANGTAWTEAPPLYVDRGPQARTLAFHGNMSWEPNVRAACFLAAEVLPTLRRLLPDAELRIAGGPLVPRLQQLQGTPGLRLDGHVADLRSWLAGADLYLAPMTQGSGVKNKLAEAMAAGMPVATNALGAEALPADARQAVRIADTATGLAAAAAELLSDPGARLQLGRAARHSALRCFGWDGPAREFAETLSALPETRLA
jgi:glycosyltransferase involved in cell wall biosynthesis